MERRFGARAGARSLLQSNRKGLHADRLYLPIDARLAGILTFGIWQGQNLILRTPPTPSPTPCLQKKNLKKKERIFGYLAGRPQWSNPKLSKHESGRILNPCEMTHLSPEGSCDAPITMRVIGAASLATVCKSLIGTCRDIGNMQEVPPSHSPRCISGCSLAGRFVLHAFVLTPTTVIPSHAQVLTFV
jgi:hypothetical protein